MKVLALDPGAERMGWAIVGRDGSTPYCHLSGILYLAKVQGAKYQAYRLELIRELLASIPVLLEVGEPDHVVTEIVPAVGGGNFAAAGQSYLANVALTTAQTVAIQAGYRVEQLAANTVQSRIAIGRRGRKVTKVQVRNGVIQLLPELEGRKKDWVKVFDEPDAIAIGLTELGFKNSGN